MCRIILLLLIFTNAVLPAQPVFFEKVFGTDETEIARSVREWPDGTIMVGGIRGNGPLGGYDFALLRLDRAGELQWTKFFGTSEDDNCLYMNTCSDGNLILAGETFTSSALLDGFIIKVDTAGNELWRRMFSSPVNESIRFIIETSDKGFICAGYQNDVNGSNDCWFLRLDSLGNEVWSQTYGSWSNDYADMIRELPDGRFIATGDTKSMGNGGYDVEVFLLDEAGIPEFDLTYGDQFQNGCQGLIVLADGNFLSYGETEIYANSAFEMFLEKIDTVGNSVWRRTFGTNGADAAFSVVENPDGTFMMTGYTPGPTGPLNLAVAKADSLGFMMWMKSYGSTGIDIGYDIQTSLDGGYLIAGRTSQSNDQFYVLHVNELGMPSSLESFVDAQIRIFPNPVSDILTIRSDQTLNRVSIFDSQGRILSVQTCSEKNIQMTVSELSAGTYMITAETGSQRINRKLVVFR